MSQRIKFALALFPAISLSLVLTTVAVPAEQGELDAVCDRLRSEGFAVERMARIATHVAEGILECAADTGADLVVIATHGRGGLPRLTLGSVADKVIRAADSPVLVVPPGAR